MVKYFPVGKKTNIVILVMPLYNLKVVLRCNLYLLKCTGNCEVLLFFLPVGKQKYSKSGFYFPILKISTSEIIPVGFIL